MKVSTHDFGKLPDGREVKIFTFETQKGMIIRITNYGGNITSIQMPDSKGRRDEITAGFEDLESYVKGHPHFGVITGRVANRIAQGKFTINNTTYHLALNNPPNHLHGGPTGFHARLWNYSLMKNGSSASLRLSYLSPDLEEGYPGNLDTVVTYTITDSDEIQIRYEATTDAPTHVNLTNHTYFNLGGFKQKVYDHLISVDSAFFVEVDAAQIPTGRLTECSDNQYDLSQDTRVEKVIAVYDGVDHCFVLNQARDTDKPVATLTHPSSGRRLRVFTTQPSIQVYTGNSLDGSCKGHNGIVYEKHTAVCLETQHYPDTPNQPDFPSTLLKPGEKYEHSATFAFDTL